MKAGKNSVMADAFNDAEKEQGSVRTEQPRATSSGLHSAFSSPLSSSNVGDRIGGYLEYFNSVLSTNKNDLLSSFEVVLLDDASNNLALSSILLLRKYKGNISVYTMSIQNGAFGINNRTVNIGNLQVDQEITTSDLIDANLWQRTVEFLTTAYGKTNFIDVGSIVLPELLEVTDKTALFEVLRSAVDASILVSRYANGENPESVTIEDIKTTDMVKGRLEFNPPVYQDVTGLPVRSDVGINLMAQLTATDALSARQSIPLTSLDAYVDIVPTNVLLDTNPYQNQYSAPKTGYFMPRLVITANGSEKPTSMAMQLLGLSTVDMLTTNNAWYRSFSPAYGKTEGIDYRDIGAVGYEVDLFGVRQPGATDTPLDKLDTKEAAFDDVALVNLLTNVMTPGISVAMDIEDAGTRTWIQRKFVAAANGNPNAVTYILDECNKLTNGAFGQIWNGTNPILGNPKRILNGHYATPTGELKDIRDLDYLAVANAQGEKDLSVVRMYADTFLNVAVPEDVRLAERLKITRMLLGESLVVTGSSQRIDFHPEFIPALAQAIANCGLRIQPEGIVHQQNGGPRSVVDPSMYMSMNTTSALYTPVQSNQGGYQSQSMGNRNSNW